MRSRKQRLTSKVGKVKIVYNPFSGQGIPLPFLSKKNLGVKKFLLPHADPPYKHILLIKQLLRAYGFSPSAIITDSPEKATQVAKHCAQKKYHLVVAVGGDGTINAVVNGLAGSNTCLGVIPLGSINIFSLQMDLPTHLEAACQRMAQGRTLSIDLGRVNQRYFTCLAGIGFDAFVLKATDPFWKKTIGVIAYGIVALFSIFFYPAKRIRFRIDDQPEIKIGYHIVVGNVKYYAGNMLLLPQADMTDNHLDVVVFKKKNPLRFIIYLLNLLLQRSKYTHDVEMLQCKKLEVLNRRCHVHVDGDYVGRIPVSICVVPKALKVIV